MGVCKDTSSAAANCKKKENTALEKTLNPLLFFLSFLFRLICLVISAWVHVYVNVSECTH